MSIDHEAAKNIAARLRKLALPDPEDERTVLHSDLFYAAEAMILDLSAQLATAKGKLSIDQPANQLSPDRLQEIIGWARTECEAFAKFPDSEKDAKTSYLWMLCLAILDLAAQLEAASKDAERYRDLLARIRQWDMLDVADDGRYWKKEIDAALRAGRLDEGKEKAQHEKARSD